jgi:transposase
MQGKKTHQEKLFIQFQLSDYVPADNFYRQLKGILDLDFLYKSTSAYYGKEGQKSVDPVVFMKLMLVGYLENINSDRRIIRTSGMRMDILFFLGHDLDEELPWHSTLSRTRKLYGEEQFVSLFKQVLKLCVDRGLLSGKRQSIDSALIRANASKDSMLEKQVMEDAKAFTKELDDNVEEDPNPPVKPKGGNDNGSGKKKGVSNKTHYSPADPDARLTKKPGKPMNLYYRSQVSVDTASHFITYIQAFDGNAADNMSLPEVIGHVVKGMDDHNITVSEVLADGGYSSGEAIKALIAHDIEGYIPNQGNYKNSRDAEGFYYDPENDLYTCQNGAQLTFKRITSAHKKSSILKRLYQSKISDCRNCPFRTTCANKKGTKMLVDSVDKHLYQQMHERVNSLKGQRMKKLRSSTVEPVFGSLINYTGLNRINTKGLKQANKCMIMAAVAYNLKKLLKHNNKFNTAQANIKQVRSCLGNVFNAINWLLLPALH